LFYLENEQAGPLLLLLHGVGRGAEDYRTFAAGLVAHWHVLALDFRGHGGSEHAPGEYLVTDYARDTVAFVRDGISQPVVIHGHSSSLTSCQRVRFPGVGHLIHQDQPAAALRALETFATTTLSLYSNHEKTSSVSAVPGL
jgi:pimeloyl-ACP methyl ester carboxylesterase